MSNRQNRKAEDQRKKPQLSSKLSQQTSNRSRKSSNQENYNLLDDEMSEDSYNPNDQSRTSAADSVQRTESQRRNSLLSGKSNQPKPTKKRKLNEMSNQLEFSKDQKYDLWIQKYKPKSMDQLLINKKKVDEFKAFVENPCTKILILTGPPGCGKNTLLEAYCGTNRWLLKRYEDTKEEHHSDVFGARRQFEGGKTDTYYPDDLENLMGFINTNCSQSVAMTQATTKVSSFCKSKQHQHIVKKPDPSESEQYRGKMLVINSLPECLKIYSDKKYQLLRDFNTVLERVVENPLKTPLIVFTFSDTNERSNSFLNKIFSEQLMSLKGVHLQVLNLNPLTDASIDKVMQLIIQNEHVQNLSEAQALDIRIKSNRDLRNAIQTLQLYSAGKIVDKTAYQSKKLKANKSRLNRIIEEEDDMDTGNFFFSQKARESQSQRVEAYEMNNEKDNPYTIFHALGKFLYNKRINPKTGQPESMPYELMKDPVTRPKLYFKHKDILNSVQLEKPAFALYLYENMHHFYSDIDDIANSLDEFSYTDNISAQTTYSYNNQQYLYEMDELNSLIDCMSVTEHNLHGRGNQKQNMFHLQKPQYYQFARESRQNKQLLKEVAMDNQVEKRLLISEDLMIRSAKEIQKNILPYLALMDNQCLKDILYLGKFQRWWQNQQRNADNKFESLREDDARDNFNQETKLEEKQLQVLRWKKRQKQNLRNQDAMQLDETSHTKMEVDEEVSDSDEEDLAQYLDSFESPSSQKQAQQKEEDELDLVMDQMLDGLSISDGKKGVDEDSLEIVIDAADIE